MSRRIWTDDEEAEILGHYTAGMGTKEIVERYGGSKSVLLRMVKRRGVQTKPGGRRQRMFTPEQVAEMGAMWHAGQSQSAIARHVGVSQVVVSRVLGQAGVERDHASRQYNRRGDKHPSWKGGVVDVAGGYLGEKVAPGDVMHRMANRQGYVLQHRLRVACSLGRPLVRGETVHHIDGDRRNNDLANLQLRQGPHGRGTVVACANCGSHDLVTKELT